MFLNKPKTELEEHLRIPATVINDLIKETVRRYTRPEIRRIKSVVKRVSKIYGVENYYCVTRIAKNKIEIRTELPSYEGGNELSNKLESIYKGWICENLGGCVYMFYLPD